MVMLQGRTCGGISKSGDRAKRSLAKESERSENLLVCAVALAARTSLPAAPFLIMHRYRCFFCMYFKLFRESDFEDFAELSDF